MRLPSMRKYDQQSVMYAHAKIDGWALSVCNGTAKTRRGTDMTELLSYLPWWRRMRLPTDYCVYGELFHPRKQSTQLKHLLLEHDTEVQFAPFASPSLPPTLGMHSTLLELACTGCPASTLVDHTDVVSLSSTSGETVDAQLADHNGVWRRDLLLRAARILGVEGWVLKDGNLQNWYRLKPVHTADLELTGLVEGNGKYLGMVGALRCSLNGREICRCSGMTDAERREISGKDIGRVVEISYERIGARGGLRHPRFVRFRDDKGLEDCKL